MTARKVKRMLPVCTVGLLILIAYSIRFIDPLPMTAHRPLQFLRTGIYCGICIVWGISVNRRIIRPQTRRMLTAVAVLMVFWIVIRTVKYMLPDDSDLGRYCWYLYYIPMLYIPLICVLTATQMGREESYDLPRWTRLLYVAAGVIALLVLTNDLHQWMFVFPQEHPFSTVYYSYGIGYLVPTLWRYGGLLGTLGMLYVRSRLPGKGRRLLVPLIPAGLLSLYHLIYLLEFPWLRTVFGDLTVTECMLVICILECCLRTGLIQSNTRYAELFRISTIRAALVDETYREYVTSTTYRPLAREIMKQAEEGPVMLEGDQQLSSAPVSGGRVFWQRDLSALTEVVQELAQVQEDLEGENAVLLENYKTERRIRRLEEQNCLYDEIRRQTSDQLRHLEELVEQFEHCEDDGEKLRLLQKMQLVGVYLKRRDNLILIGNQDPVLQKRELELCFEESLQRLEACGLESALYMNLADDLPLETATALYDFYETVAEHAFDGLQSLLVRLYQTERGWVISVTAATEADLSGISGENVTVTREEGAWTASLRVKGGGSG